jgi:hypothetical protein
VLSRATKALVLTLLASSSFPWWVAGLVRAQPLPLSGSALILTSQPPYVIPGEPFSVSFAIPGLSDITVNASLELYAPASSRSDLEATVRRGRGSRVVASIEETLARGAAGAFNMALDLLPSAAPAASVPYLRLPCYQECYGNYPALLTVRSSTRTYQLLIVLTVLDSQKASQPLLVNFLVPLEPDLASPGATLSAQLSALARELSALSRLGTTGFTLAPDPGALMLSGAIGGRGAARALQVLLGSTTGFEHVASPMHDLPPPSSSEAHAYSSDLAAGIDAEGSMLAAPPSVCALARQSVSAAYLSGLLAHHLTCLLAQASAFEAPQLSLTPTEPLGVAGYDQQLRVLLYQDFSSLLDPSQPYLSLMRLLADLSQVYFEAPNSGQPRGLAVFLPTGVDLDLAQLETLAAASPQLRLASLTSMLSSLAVPDGDRRSLLRLSSGRPPVPWAKVPQRTASQAQAIASALPSSAASSAAEAAYFTLLDPSLSSPVRSRLLDFLAGTVDRLAACVRLSVPSTVTLTSQEGHLPITASACRSFGRPQLRLSLASDNLSFPAGRTQEFVAQSSGATVYVPIKARGPGTFPLRLQLTTPSGYVLASHRILVRYGSFSLAAYVLTGASLALLAYWWAMTVAKRARARARKAPGFTRGKEPQGVG